MILKSFLISIFIFHGILLQAQRSDSTFANLYKTNPTIEITGPVIFFCGAFFGFKALDKYASLTEEDVLKLDPQTINSFDRPVAFYNPSEFAAAQASSDLILNISVASPALLLLDKNIRHEWKDFISLFLMAHMVDNTIYFASVVAVRRPRPLTYNPEVPIEDKVGEGKSNSFFSGHTSWTATSTFLLAKIYTDYHQIKGVKRLLIYTGAAIPPALVGYYRMEAGKHFKTDVITGLLVGAACGIGIPELHRIKNKDNGLSFRPFMMQGANGITLTYNIK